MKNSSLVSALVLGAALILNVTGCHRGPKTPLTLIPGRNVQVGDTGPSGPRGPGSEPGISTGPTTDVPVTGSPIDEKSKYGPTGANGIPDPTKFAADTVYFDTDSSTIKKSEEAKLQDVAGYFKNNTTLEGVRVEGYCDERGTEQYNLALGEKRAGAIRDYLANLGVDAQRVFTVSYGEAKPVEGGHDEAAWKKNRRGVFILLLPPK